ncbi:hypothetical protein C8039_12705 [Halogeometricum sp. wsp3]|nr:hypothetical protein C8039_12705 [Halogeometricum sp. wsp3]
MRAAPYHELHADIPGYNLDFADYAWTVRSRLVRGQRAASSCRTASWWAVDFLPGQQSSVHPGERTRDGLALQTMRECRLNVALIPKWIRSVRGIAAHVRHAGPREGERDDGSRIEIRVPDGFGEGVNSREGLESRVRRYPSYSRAPRAGSHSVLRGDTHLRNVRIAEKYARIHRDASGPVHARDGPIAAMGHLLIPTAAAIGRSSRTMTMSRAEPARILPHGDTRTEAGSRSVPATTTSPEVSSIRP